MTRTDIHRPSAIIPEDYLFVAFEYLRIDGLGDAAFLMAERQRLRAHMERTGGTYASHTHGGNCHVCGSANAVYTAMFYHAKTNAYVRTGLDCAEKLECAGVEAFRRNVATALEQKAGKRKAAATLAAGGLSKAWAVYEAEPAESDRREESIIRDIVGKLVKYGSLSPAQFGLLGKLADAITRRSEIDAQRAAENAAAAPVPVCEKRMTVEGTVLSIRTPDYQRGDCGPVRMLVQHPTGWKVWGSVPSAVLPDLSKGSRIRFDAAVKVSDKDSKFGFFSRPTKAAVLKATG
ncbi:hypothetical protein [Bradyrhizobium sp. RT10b]|uniref:hypothetical protein n=1 Tax=Bradyrhizobium sp. RT10b TaxID=3156331 RepID=UPI00339545F3